MDIPFFSRLLRRPELSLSSCGLLFSLRESILSWLICRFTEVEVWPLVSGVPPRAEGRYSGVFLVEDTGLSIDRFGVKLLSDSRSRSRRWTVFITGVNVAGAVLTGVNPPALTGVNPPEAFAGAGVNAGESNIGMFLISWDSFI